MAPMTVFASGADTVEVGANLLEDIDPEYSSVAVEMETDEEGVANGFLQVKRANTWSNGDTRWRGLAYTFNTPIEKGNTYFLEFRMRTTTKPVNTNTDDSSIATDGKNYTRIRINGNVTHSTTNSTSWSVKSAGQGTELLHNKNGMDEIWINEEWNTYVVALENVTATADNAYIYFCGGTGDFPESFEIDDFRLYTIVDGNPSNCTEDCYDFSTLPRIETHTEAVKGVFQPIWQNDFTKSSKPSVIYVNRTSGYSRIPANSGSDTCVSYDMDGLMLTPGTYKLEAELRRGDWYMDGSENKSNVTATIDFAEGTNDRTFKKAVDITWSNVSEKITITENTELSAISFETLGESNALDIGNVSFMLVAPLLDGTTEELGSSTTLTTTDLLDGATVTFGDSATKSVPVNADNGYLTIAPRTGTVNMNLFPIKLNVIPDGETTYYVSFNIRSSVLLSNNDTSRTDTDLFRFRVMANVDNVERVNAGYSEKYIVPTSSSTVIMDKDPNGSNRYGRIPMDGEWAHFEGKFTPSASEGSLELFINRGTADERLPIDIDDFKVWTDDGEIFSADFNDSTKLYVGTSTDYNKFYPSAGVSFVYDIQDEFIRVTPNAENIPSVSYDLTGIGAVYGEGIYSFDAELRAGEYVFDNYPYKGTNDSHEVTVTFNLNDIDATDGDEDKTEVITRGLNTMWEEMQFSVIVPAGYELTGYTVTTNYTGMPLDVKNAKLSSDKFPVIEDTESDDINYLNGVTMRTENTTPVLVSNDDTTYLSIGERLNDSTNFLVIKLKADMNAGEKYYVSMRVRGTDGATTKIRPKFDLDSKDDTLVVMEAFSAENGGNLTVDGLDTVAGMNAEYIVPTQAVVDAGVSSWVIMDHEAGDHKRVFPLTNVTSEWQTFEGYFTLAQDVSANASQIVIQRGNDSKHVQPFEIDDLVVWKQVGDRKSIVYENYFENEEDLDGIAAKAVIDRITPVSDYFCLEPFDVSSEMTITYNLALTDEQRVEGRYRFGVKVRTATEAQAKAVVSFIYNDGTTDTERFTIGNDWSGIGITKSFDAAPNIKAISISIDSDVPVFLTAPKLNIQYKWEHGYPNWGITMVLLKKMQGKMQVPKRVEFLPDGDFETIQPVIYNSAIAKTQTEADAGFWAKQTAGHATTLEVVTEENNTFVRVNDVDTSARGVWYNTGITLEPGEYTFSVDLRVSENPEANNYTAYTWHSEAKDWQYMRTILQDPNQMSIGHYDLFDPVDKKTAMNDTGYVVGYQSKVTREWTTYTDTIVIDKPTVIIFKIGGGTSGQPDSHGFDIDNVSLKGYASADKTQG